MVSRRNAPQPADKKGRGPLLHKENKGKENISLESDK